MAGEPEVVGEEQQHEPGVGHEVPRDDAPWTEKQRHLGSLRDLVRDCCSEAADLFKVSVSVRWWTRGLGLGRGPAQAGVGGYDAGRVLGHVGRRRPRDGDLGSDQSRRVAHPVAAHTGRVPRPLGLFDDGQFFLWQSYCQHVRDPAASLRARQGARGAESLAGADPPNGELSGG